MSDKRNRHQGSSLDSLLAEDGTLEQVNALAAKRVLAWQIAEEMKRQGLTKARMARNMGTSRSALERLMDPDNGSVTLNTVYRAARVLGKRLRIDLVNAA